MKILNKIISRVDYRLRALAPTRLAARTSGVSVLANSIPKGGTHLLTRCLSLFPRLSYSGIHFKRGSARRDQLESLIRRNGKGRFMAAHLWWSQESSFLLSQYGFKSILMLRDPRDVVISGVFYILKRKDHHLHEYFSTFPDLDSLITAYITGVEASKSSKGIALANINDSFGNYTPWINERYNLLILFEDLVGSRGGGEHSKQIDQIKTIAEHIDQELSREQIDYIATNTYMTRSVTFRKGVSGEWSKYFNKKNKTLFKDLAGQLLITFGYETDIGW